MPDLEMPQLATYSSLHVPAAGLLQQAWLVGSWWGGYFKYQRLHGMKIFVRESK
jgi:hypothetical protein